MEDKTVRWDSIKRKIWFQQKVARIKDGAKRFGNWVIENPIAAMTLAGMTAGIVNKASRAYCTHAEDVRRRRDFYDTRTGRHAHIRRDLKAWEQEEVDERFQQGESYVKIFRDMNILK